MPRRPSPINGTSPFWFQCLRKVTHPCAPIIYRGIALMSTYAKLYNRLLGRIRDGLDNHLRQNQNGFFLFAPLVNKSLRGTTEYMKRLSPLRTPPWYPPISTSPKSSTRWNWSISRIFYSPMRSQSKRSMRLCPSITGLLQRSNPMGYLWILWLIIRGWCSPRRHSCTLSVRHSHWLGSL